MHRTRQQCDWGYGKMENHQDQADWVSRTAMNPETGEYYEVRVPLRQAYEELLEELERCNSPEERLRRQDDAAQHKAWRESMRQASEFQTHVTNTFRGTLKDARFTFRLLTAMSATMFLLGLGLFAFAVGYGVSGTASYSAVFAGLGVSTFIAVFILGPFARAQAALSNLVQIEMVFMSYFEQIRMWSNHAWQGADATPNLKEASAFLHRRTNESIKDLQHFLEDDAAAPAPTVARRTKTHAKRP